MTGLICLHRRRVSGIPGPTRFHPLLLPLSIPRPTTVMLRMKMMNPMMKMRRPRGTGWISNLHLCSMLCQRGRSSNQESQETEMLQSSYGLYSWMDLTDKCVRGGITAWLAQVYTTVMTTPTSSPFVNSCYLFCCQAIKSTLHNKLFIKFVERLNLSSSSVFKC